MKTEQEIAKGIKHKLDFFNSWRFKAPFLSGFSILMFFWFKKVIESGVLK